MNDVQQFLVELLYAVLVVSIPILAKYIVAYLDSKKSEIEADQKDINFNNTISKALEIVSTVVKYVSQTYVDDLKAQGKFDVDAQAEALNKAMKIIQSQLDEETKNLIITAYGDLQQWLRVQIESTIKDSK